MIKYSASTFYDLTSKLLNKYLYFESKIFFIINSYKHQLLFLTGKGQYVQKNYGLYRREISNYACPECRI